MNAAIAIPEVFTFQEAHKVRTVLQNNELWFVAKDVFAVLGVYWAGVRSLSMIPEAWRVVVNLTTTQKNQHGTQEGQTKDLHCINFKGLCKIAFRSNKPEADSFTNWAAEVIDTVMKTGSYALQQTPEPVRAIEYITQQQYDELAKTVHDLSYCFQFKQRAIWWAWAELRTLSGGEPVKKMPAEFFDVAKEKLKGLYLKSTAFRDLMYKTETAFFKKNANLVPEEMQLMLDQLD